MANTIILKKSSTASAIPDAGDLQAGEIAVNLADQKLYSKTTGGTVILVGSGLGGSGTVTSVAATAGTGISITGSPITTSGTLNITNTAPDQTVALTQGGTTTITGTYPNFTISSADQYQGTVTSVSALTLGTSGTDLNSTVATSTTTPVITLNVPTASATNRGALSSADWTTFNNKGSGTVTSVTGTAPVVSSGGTTPAISMAAATTSVSGYLTSTDWTTFNNKGSGTVTSVAATVPSVLSISGSPITTSGTLAITYSGTALPIANGGTGQTSFTANYIHYGSFSTSANLTYNGTDFTCGGNVTAYSDERLKTNWRGLPPNFIDELVKVKHGIYDRTDIHITQCGVGAQSLQKIMPHAVIKGEDDDRLAVAYGNAAMVAVIELAKRVLELEKRLEEKTNG